MPILAWPLATALAVTGFLAGVFDLRCRRIPNWLVVAAFCAGLCIRLWMEGIGGGATSLMGTSVALVVYLPLYLLRAVGGGDLKLMAAVGAIGGPGVWVLVFVIASLTGGAVALVVIVARSRVARTFANVGTIFKQLIQLRSPFDGHPSLDVTKPDGVRLPHGTVIGAAIGIYLTGSWMK